MAIDIQKGLKLLSIWNGRDARITYDGDYVVASTLWEELDESQAKAMLQIGWGPIDDYVGYKIGYTPAFEQWFKNSRWFSMADDTTKPALFEAWQQGIALGVRHPGGMRI